LTRRAGVGLMLLAGLVPARAQSLQYEYLFTLGTGAGVNPPQRFSHGFGKLFFGRPERPSPVGVPSAVAVDPDERIWIADRGQPSVHMFDLLRNRYWVLRGAGKSPFRCPTGIDSDQAGVIYVADACAGKILLFDRDGSFLRALPGDSAWPVQPWSVRVRPDRKVIYVSDPTRHRVVVFNQEGESIGALGRPGDLEFPTALALDPPAKRILVLDAARRRVQAFSWNGNWQQSLSWSQVREPSAFVFDPEQRRYFLGDPRYETVQVFDEEGFSVGFFGQQGSGLEELRTPTALYVDFRQRIYVVDSLNGKVVVFREKP